MRVELTLNLDTETNKMFVKPWFDGVSDKFIEQNAALYATVSEDSLYHDLLGQTEGCELMLNWNLSKDDWDDFRDRLYDAIREMQKKIKEMVQLGSLKLDQ